MASIRDVPIEENIVPLPAHEITISIAVGQSTATFELLDTDRLIYGNSAVYLVQDCALWLSRTTISSSVRRRSSTCDTACSRSSGPMEDSPARRLIRR